MCTYAFVLWLYGSYILRRPQNLAKYPPIIWLAVWRTNNWWRFRKILWPSQNIWTLQNAWNCKSQIPFFKNCVALHTIKYRGTPPISHKISLVLGSKSYVQSTIKNTRDLYLLFFGRLGHQGSIENFRNFAVLYFCGFYFSISFKHTCTINCTCQSIESVFIVLGIFNIGPRIEFQAWIELTEKCHPFHKENNST